MIKDNLPQEKWESIFPIKLGHLTCNSVINALVIRSNLLSLNFGSYKGRRDVDNNGFTTKVLSVKGQFPIVPHLEDLWKDFNNEKEVLRRDHSRLTLTNQFSQAEIPTRRSG